MQNAIAITVFIAHGFPHRCWSDSSKHMNAELHGHTPQN